MKVRYIGPFRPGVFIPVTPYDAITAEYGAPVDVPDDMGARLIEQTTNWEPVTDAPAKSADADGEKSSKRKAGSA